MDAIQTYIHNMIYNPYRSRAFNTTATSFANSSTPSAFPMDTLTDDPDGEGGTANPIVFTIWITGYYWESISDHQLFKFIHNPANKGHVMTRGLWHYSRLNCCRSHVSGLAWTSLNGPITTTVAGPHTASVSRSNVYW